MPRKSSSKVIYIVYSEMRDWEGGEWSPDDSCVTRFTVHSDAIAAFRKNQEALDAQAKGDVATMREIVKPGGLMPPGGFTVGNLLFGVPSKWLSRLGEARADDNREDELEQLAADLPEYVLESGCYQFDSWKGWAKVGPDDVLENLDPALLLEEGDNAAG